jgi:hypothetical protein
MGQKTNSDIRHSIHDKTLVSGKVNTMTQIVFPKAVSPGNIDIGERHSRKSQFRKDQQS